MKTGKSLVDLATEVQRQHRSKKDYLADTRKITMSSATNSFFMEGMGNFGVNDIAHGQLSNMLKIPKIYYDRMRKETPGLLADNVNHWLEYTPATKLVRTMDRNVRAVLSNRFRTMDNYDLMNAVLPILRDMSLQMISCDITDRKLYLKATYPALRRDIVPGDVVEAGIMVANSEVGFGTLVVSPFVNRLICSNGMVVNDAGMKRRHLGRSWGEGDGDPREVFSDETRVADDKALWLKVRDVVKATVSEDSFDGYVRKFVESTEVQLPKNIQKVVEVTSKNLNLSQDEGQSVLQHLIKGGDLSAWGLANAVTRTAEDSDSYDRATDLEIAGGKVVELKQKVWAA